MKNKIVLTLAILIYSAHPSAGEELPAGWSIYQVTESESGNHFELDDGRYSVGLLVAGPSDIQTSVIAIQEISNLGIREYRVGIHLIFTRESWTRIWLWSRLRSEPTIGIFFDGNLICTLKLDQEGSIALPVTLSAKKSWLLSSLFPFRKDLPDGFRVNPRPVQEWSLKMIQSFYPTRYLLDRYIWSSIALGECSNAQTTFEQYGPGLKDFRQADYIVECFAERKEYSTILDWTRSLCQRFPYHGGYVRYRAYKFLLEKQIPGIRNKIRDELKSWLKTIPENPDMLQLKWHVRDFIKEI
tara:strand:+ start:72 stop:968 length:897 start_codon:yes stop_codon:yes gene_type:complete